MATSLGSYKGTAINPGSDAEVQAQMQAIDAGAPMPVSSLGGGTINTANFPTAPDMTAQYQNATKGAIDSSKTPAVDPYADVKTMIADGNNNSSSLVDAYKASLNDGSYVNTQKEVNDLTAQLNSITANTTTAQLGLEGQDVRRSAPVLDKMQNQIARDNAIKALPIAAALNAAQGRLSSAKENITTLLDLTYKDQTSKYNEAKDQIAYAMQFADAKQKEQLQARADALEATKLSDSNFNSLKETYITAAINNKDFKTAGALAAAKDDATLQKLISGMSTATGTADAPTIKSINGVDMQWNPATGTWETPSGVKGGGPGGELSPYQDERMYRNLQSVDELGILARQSPQIFGRSAAIPMPEAFRSDAYRNFKPQLDTLIANITFGELTAMREASKTGGALGQVSDTEGRLLGSALGALKMSQTPEAFNAQLTKIKESILRWKTAMQNGTSGGSAPTITAPTGEQIIITD